jgi:hypothetical protein
MNYFIFNKMSFLTDVDERIGYLFHIERYGRFHIVKCNGSVYSVFFDEKIIKNDADSLQDFVKLSDGRFIVRNGMEGTLDLYRLTGDTFEVLTYPSNIKFNNKYIVYIVDNELRIGFLEDFVKYGGLEELNSYRKYQVLDSNAHTYHIDFITNSGVIYMYVEGEEQGINRLPLESVQFNENLSFDTTTGIFSNSHIYITRESPKCKYAVISFENCVSIVTPRFQIEKIDGNIIGPLEKIKTVNETVLLLQSGNIDKIRSDIEWVLEDIILISHPGSMYDPYLINLINLKTVEIIDLYEPVPDVISPGYYFKSVDGFKFISDGVMLRRPRELLSPYTKTNLNILEVIKEIPTSVTNRIGRYV